MTVLKLGKKIIAKWRSRFKTNSMGDDKKYDPAVYKRLELVTKQFQNQTSTQKKLRQEESKQRFLDWLNRNKSRIVRLTLYTVLSLLVLAVIIISIIK